MMFSQITLERGKTKKREESWKSNCENINGHINRNAAEKWYTRMHTHTYDIDTCCGWFCKLLTKHKLQEIMNDKSNGNQNDTEMLPLFPLFGRSTQRKKVKRGRRRRAQSIPNISKMQFDDVKIQRHNP